MTGYLIIWVYEGERFLFQEGIKIEPYSDISLEDIQKKHEGKKVVIRGFKTL